MTEMEVLRQVGDGGALVLAAWCVLELRRMRAAVTELLERIVRLETNHQHLKARKRARST